MKRKFTNLIIVAAFFIVTNADSQTAYITDFTGNCVYVIDVTTSTVIDTIAVGSGPFGVSVSPDGTRVYVTNQNSGTVSVINTANDSVVATIPLGSGLYGIAVSPDGTKVYAARNNQVDVINTATNTVTATINLIFGPLEGIAISHDGSKVYAACNSLYPIIYVINTANNAVLDTIHFSVGYNPYGCAISPDDRKLYVTENGGYNTFIINTVTDSIIDTIIVGEEPQAICVSPDGSRIYVAAFQEGYVSVIDSLSNHVIGDITICNTNGLPEGISISPDGTKLYTTASATNPCNTVTIYNTVTSAVNIITIGNELVSFGNFISTHTAITTGLASKHKESPSISIYPNPASTLLNIHQSSPSPNQQLIITDLLGTEVYKEMLTGIDNTISISTWSAGIYFYEVRGANETARGKFVKMN